MSRFLKKLRKGIDNLMAPAEDPRETFVQTSDRQRAMLARVQKALLETGAAKERLIAKAEEVRQQLPQLEQRARQSLKTGREDFARLALQRYKLIQAELHHLEAQLLQIEQEESRLWLTEQRLSSQIEAFYTRMEFAAARYSAAEAQVQISEALSGVSEELAELNQAMEQTEQRSAYMEARAAAIEELVAANILEAPGLMAGDLWQIAPAELDGDVEAHLAALKQQLA